jgi:hypothetical protein
MNKDFLNRIFDLSELTDSAIARKLIVSQYTVKAWRNGRQPNVKSQVSIRKHFKKEIAKL